MSPVISSTTKVLRLCTAALAVCAISAPATFAYAAESDSSSVQRTPSVEPTTGSQDLRSPDGIDAATPRVDTGAQDLRSPDAVDAATPRLDAGAQDLRSPDAVDAATPRLDGASDGVSASSSVSASGGFDWSSAGIAMAALLGLIIAASAAATYVRHARSSVARP